jgi:hypothetical protein
MNTLILSLHIIVALITTVATAGVFAAAYARRETKLYTLMMGSFALTATSGISLLFVTSGQLGHVCAMMTFFLLATLVARAYYRTRVVTAQVE